MNTVTLHFPTKEHANAFAIWAESMDGFEDFLNSKWCKTADNVTKQEIGDIQVNMDDSMINVNHEIHLT